MRGNDRTPGYFGTVFGDDRVSETMGEEMTSFRQKRIQVIGLTEVNCADYDVPGAEHEGCNTIQITFVDRVTLKVHQVTGEEIGGP